MHRGRFIIGLGAFATASVARAPAQVRIRPRMQFAPPAHVCDLGNQGALYQSMISVGNAGFTFTAAALPRRSFSAKIVQQQTRQNAMTAVRDIGRSSKATVAINGGRFNGAFAPDGLLIVDNEVIGQKRADWIGYLTVDGDGNASVTAKPDLRRAQYAVQGDVLIIEPGGKMGMWREDNERFRRTIIAQSGDVILALVTSPVSLFTLAYALMERPDAFYLNHFDAALNLSGAATTGFYAKLTDGSEVTVPEYWPNRDVVTFSPRLLKA